MQRAPGRQGNPDPGGEWHGKTQGNKRQATAASAAGRPDRAGVGRDVEVLVGRRVADRQQDPPATETGGVPPRRAPGGRPPRQGAHGQRVVGAVEEPAVVAGAAVRDRRVGGRPRSRPAGTDAGAGGGDERRSGRPRPGSALRLRHGLAGLGRGRSCGPPIRRVAGRTAQRLHDDHLSRRLPATENRSARGSI